MMTNDPRRLTPYQRGNRFYNYEGERFDGFLLRSLYMLLLSWFNGRRTSPDHVKKWFAPTPLLSDRSEELRIMWLGHASFLIQIGGLNILTDPILGRLSLLFPRLLPSPMRARELPPIDIVLLSHNHRDHMDAATLRRLRARNNEVVILAPQGDRKWFEKREFEQAYEHEWWESRVLPTFTGPNRVSSFVRCTFLPAFHWSQRGFFDRNKSLWGSWMIEWGTKRIYFGGDTAFSTHFSSISYEFSRIDIAILPIGPCEPRAWMKHVHLSAPEAVKAFIELEARHFIPMHWGTFGFGIDHTEAPMQYLRKEWEERYNELGRVGAQLHTPAVGQILNFP